MIYHFDDNITVSELTESEFPLWDAFVHRSPQGTFFNSSDWAKVLREVFERDFCILVSKTGDQIESGILVFEHRKMNHLLATAVPFYPFSGPLFYLPEDEKKQRTVAKRLKLSNALVRTLNQRYAIWRISTHQSHKDMRSYLWNGSVVTPTYTYEFDLDGEIRDQYSQSLRRKLKRVDPNCIKSEPVPGAKSLLQLYKKSYQRHGLVPPLSDVQALRFLHIILKNPLSKIYYYQDDEQIMAMRIIIQDRQTAYDLMAGSDDEFGNAALALVDQALHNVAGSASSFDFMGADHPEIEKFKRSFGGRLTVRYNIANRPKFPYSAALRWKEMRNRKERGL